MDLATWFGFLAGVLLLAWGVQQAGGGTLFVNAHGLALVFGGTLCATLVNTPFRVLWSGLRRFFSIFLSSQLPSVEETVVEMVRLAERSRAEGLLALQNEGQTFMNGFLSRALNVAITSGEAKETRRILEGELRHRRLQTQEDANLFRTMGVLAPMFGLLGTLLGIVEVLRSMSEPTRVGGAMALAITTAFYGIAIANLICVPVAGKIRLRAMQEGLILEVIVEGVLDILESKPPYLVELHLSSYASEKRQTLQVPAAAPQAGGA
ncbi:MAG: MotA/TolQ/ExbB proton channel family protein [Elusimicrobia bacterium]|nr:MotA/TolQ/ExbB proton channel family protein [Elusimicrobiota bacterium]